MVWSVQAKRFPVSAKPGAIASNQCRGKSPRDCRKKPHSSFPRRRESRRRRDVRVVRNWIPACAGMTADSGDFDAIALPRNRESGGFHLDARNASQNRASRIFLQSLRVSSSLPVRWMPTIRGSHIRFPGAGRHVSQCC